MLELRHPLPVVTPLGEGYAIYVQSGGAMENDIWCVVLDDARILHFRSNDLLYVGNATLGLARPAQASGSKLAETTQKLAAKAKALSETDTAGENGLTEMMRGAGLR